MRLVRWVPKLRSGKRRDSNGVKGVIAYMEHDSGKSPCKKSVEIVFFGHKVSDFIPGAPNKVAASKATCRPSGGIRQIDEIVWAQREGWAGLSTTLPAANPRPHRMIGC